MIKLMPSILSADFFHLGMVVESLKSGGADGIHIDVMDGHLVPNISMGPMIVKSLRAHTDMFLDVHLMISDPDDYIDVFADAGANSITIHMEAAQYPLRVIERIRRHHLSAAVALNPVTSLSCLDYILSAVDMILVMTVDPGFGGQKFIPAMIDKVRKLKEKINASNLDIDIQVDGGICLDNVRNVINAGANIIVTGSAILNQNDIKAAVRQFKERMLQEDEYK